MKKAIELLETAKLDLIKFSRDHSLVGLAMCALSNIEESLYELKAPPRWETPEQWEKRTGEKYPDDAPVWGLSKSAIKEKPTKYNRLRWWLLKYGEAVRNGNEIIFCAYNHLGPPPNDWRPEEENNVAE